MFPKDLTFLSNRRAIDKRQRRQGELLVHRGQAGDLGEKQQERWNLRDGHWSVFPLLCVFCLEVPRQLGSSADRSKGLTSVLDFLVPHPHRNVSTPE